MPTIHHAMTVDPHQLTSFKADVQQAKDQHRDAWESSTKLLGQSSKAETISRLVVAIQGSHYPSELTARLIGAIEDGEGHRLKELTGLPTSKAIRALCVLFGVAGSPTSSAPSSAWSPSDIEALIRSHRNPYDLLLDVDVASLLDLGAGDLSFVAEFAERYVPFFTQRQRKLVVHAVDRLQPGSQLGGRLHADPAVLRKLKQTSCDSSSAFDFEFWGNQDMFALDSNTEVWPSYTMVTCHGPATPTFAYEPTRVSCGRIEADLARTKGRFRIIRMDREDALEVDHAGRALLFPPWKFEVRGPLALLNLIARRGKCCLLTSVDTQVFWEILSQLLDDPRLRPPDLIFTPQTLPEIFGPRYTELTALPVGSSVVLSDLGALRSALPTGRGGDDTMPRYRFRYVEIRRGAVFEGMPAGQTARLFQDMVEEAPPWFFILVPEPAA